MSSAYWNQWDSSEIESMHGIDHEHSLDCYLEEVKIKDEDEKDSEMFACPRWEHAYMVD